MNRMWTVLLMASALRGADVTLWTTGQGIVSNPVACVAIDQATRMYAAIGVRIEWKRQAGASGSGVTIQVRFTTEMPGHPGAFGFSNPFDPEPVVTIMYDRILSATDWVPELRPALLAHVLVHEIGHELKKSDAHSPEGVMKAHWVSADYSRMAFRPLQFLPGDVALIRRRLELTAETR